MIPCDELFHKIFLNIFQINACSQESPGTSLGLSFLIHKIKKSFLGSLPALSEVLHLSRS